MSSSPLMADKKTLTPLAKEWALELAGLTGNDIAAGLKNLSKRVNNAFPPNALEFKSICQSGSVDEVIQEIMRFINRSQDSQIWWDTKIAYTVFQRLNYIQGDNETRNSLVMRIRAIYKVVDKNNLMELPEQPTASLTHQEFKATKAQKKQGVQTMKSTVVNEPNSIFNDIWPAETTNTTTG